VVWLRQRKGDNSESRSKTEKTPLLYAPNNAMPNRQFAILMPIRVANLIMPYGPTIFHGKGYIIARDITWIAHAWFLILSKFPSWLICSVVSSETGLVGNFCIFMLFQAHSISKHPLQ
jgi:hypothetical protein